MIPNFNAMTILNTIIEHIETYSKKSLNGIKKEIKFYFNVDFNNAYVILMLTV